VPDALPTLDLDLSALEITTQGTSSQGSILYGRSKGSSRTSLGDPGRGLIIPSDTDTRRGSLAPLGLERQSALNLEEETGFLDDVGFQFDAEGNLIEDGPIPAVTSGGIPDPPRGESRDRAWAQQQPMEDDFMRLQDEVSCTIPCT